ncbi:MAG: porin [Pseudomonadota bacterium]
MNKRTLLGLLLVCAIWAPTARSEEAAPSALPSVGYDKGFFIETADKNFKLVLRGYLQPYFDNKFPDSRAETRTFRIRRARFIWSGYFFSKDVQYEVEYDWAVSKLMEASVQLVQSDALKFRFGQYHVPFSLEQAASSSTLQFVDRSIVFPFFGVSDEREPGAGFNGLLLNRRFEYNVGAFNGEGLNTLNQNKALRYAWRFIWNVAGEHGMEFSDTKNSQKPQVALAVGGMYNDTPDPATIPAGKTTPTTTKKVTSLTADASAKYHGLGFHAAYLSQQVNPQTGPAMDDRGFLAQAGYFVIPEKLEFGLRLAHIYAESAKDLGEYTAGVNYFFYNGHQLKLQLDYSALTVKDGLAAGKDELDHQVRAQLQLKL